MENNKTTSFRSSRKISVMINNVLEKKEKRTRMGKSFQFRKKKTRFLPDDIIKKIRI